MLSEATGQFGSIGILGDQLLLNAKQKKHIKMLCWFHCAMKQSITPVPLFCIRQTDAARKTMFIFCICDISQNKAKSSEKKTGHSLIHLNKPACKIWSCFGNVQLQPKICNAPFPPNPSIISNLENSVKYIYYNY